MKQNKKASYFRVLRGCILFSIYLMLSTKVLALSCIDLLDSENSSVLETSKPIQRSQSGWPENITHDRDIEKLSRLPLEDIDRDFVPTPGRAYYYYDYNEEELSTVSGIEILRISDFRPPAVQVINTLRSKSKKWWWSKQVEVGVFVAVAQDGREFVSDYFSSNKENRIEGVLIQESFVQFVKNLFATEGMMRFRSFHLIHTHPTFNTDEYYASPVILSKADLTVQHSYKGLYTQSFGAHASFHFYALPIDPNVYHMSHYSF